MSQPEKWTIRALLAWTKSYFEQKGIESPRLDAELLLGHATGKSRIDLLVGFEEEPDEATRGVFRELVRRRALGEPVAYLVGKKEFYSLDFEVDRNVLVPRPETEQLVLETIEYYKSQGWKTGVSGAKRVSAEFVDYIKSTTGQDEVPEVATVGDSDVGALRICDVGVGSGCISCALAANVPAARIVGLDVSPGALTVARRNVERLGLAERVELLESDLLAAIPSDLPESERFDAIVSNPPYVSEPEYNELEPTVRNFEPRLALVGGTTGAELPNRLVVEACDRLRSGGRLALELSPTTVDLVAKTLDQDERWRDVEIRKDFAGLRRFIVAFRR